MTDTELERRLMRVEMAIAQLRDGLSRPRALDSRDAVHQELLRSPEWVTINTVCREASVSRRTVYNWLQRGFLEYQRVPSGAVRVKRGSWIGVHYKGRRARNREAS